MTTPAISTTDLTKTYRTLLGRSFPALSELNLEVPRGSVYGLLGPNGAGKTTTILLLLGILHPTGGRFSLLGEPMGSRKVRGRVGYLPEKFQLPGFLKASEFLRFQGRLFGLGGKTLDERIAALLPRVGLENRADSPIATFSKGMQQRLALAQALIHDPELVILDEPTSALDAVGRLEVRGIVEGLRREGKTVLLNSHILSDVEHLCDRVAILRKGRLERQGPISTLASPDLKVHVRVGGWSDRIADALAPMGTTLRLESAQEVADLTLAVPDDEAIPGVARAIQDAGGRLYALTPSRESLEELFMRIVREEP